MHILSAEQFDQEQQRALFEQADEFKQQLRSPEDRIILASRYVGSNLCSLFYEPSTRTRLSFEFAAGNLGLKVAGTENAREFSSAAKGETLEDTIRVINEYGVDIIVLRHTDTGSAAHAASVSNASIVNAGDGSGEHPTQALLDAYTIQRFVGRLDNLHVVMGGDLRHGRTARSLASLLSKYPNNHMSFVTVPELQMGEDIKAKLLENNTPFSETVDMLDAFRYADVVYWTRLQKERLENPEAVPESGFIIDSTALEVLPKASIIMHPLPRVGEIDPSVDNDPRAVYFQQAGNGLYIRMALIEQILASK